MSNQKARPFDIVDDYRAAVASRHLHGLALAERIWEAMDDEGHAQALAMGLPWPGAMAPIREHANCTNDTAELDSIMAKAAKHLDMAVGWIAQARNREQRATQGGPGLSPARDEMISRSRLAVKALTEAERLARAALEMVRS